MAQVDFGITQANYDKMMVVLDGIRSKLATEKDVLTRIMATDNGQAKVKAFAAAQDPGWLREVGKFRNDLNDYFEAVGWRDDA